MMATNLKQAISDNFTKIKQQLGGLYGQVQHTLSDDVKPLFKNLQEFAVTPQTLGAQPRIRDLTRNAGQALGAIGQGIDEFYGLPGRLATTDPKIPRGFSQQVGGAVEETTGSELAGLGAGLAAGFAEPVGGFGKAKPTLKSLERLAAEVKTPTVSKKFLIDLTNRGDIKQAERDLLRKAIDEVDDVKVNVKQFANRVKTELLPLKSSSMEHGRYENVSLSDDLRGPVASYNERIYQSPIKTSAGGVHFGGSTEGKAYDAENYFAHTRIEDLPTAATESAEQSKWITGIKEDKNWNDAFGTKEEAIAKIKAQREQAKRIEPTRRIIEIQSDLFQKGRLEVEAQEIRNIPGGYPNQIKVPSGKKRQAEIARLEPYRNTWWERVIREEVKQAAKDGKTKLQFPTGETAMKIEGLGSGEARWTFDNQSPAAPSELKVGREIWESEEGIGMIDEDDPWVITEVLGNGRFKAIRKEIIDKAENGVVYQDQNMRAPLASFAEEFDISGKIDTENPIYRFYEKDVQKYLTKKYGAKVITDPQGVKWIEMNVPKGAAKMPVEAFGGGILGASMLNQQEQ